MDPSPTPAPASEPAPANSRWRQRRWQIGAAAIPFFLAGLYVVQYVTQGAFWQSSFEAAASKRVGRPVHVSGTFELYLRPDIHFRADGLTVANPDWAASDQFFTARSITLDASVWQALFGTFGIADLKLDGARLALQRRADRRNTWTFSGGKFEIPEITTAAITDSRIAFIDAPTQTSLDVSIGAIASSASSRAQQIAGPLTFAGSGTTGGSPVKINGSLTTPNQAAIGGLLGLDLTASIARTRLTLKGTLPGATRFDDAPLALTVTGQNLQDPGRLFGVILPATRPYRLAATLTKSGSILRLTRLSGRIGDSDLSGTLTTTFPENSTSRVRIDGTLNSKMLDIKDVGPLVGYDPARLEAGSPLTRQIDGRPRLLPDSPLATEALGKFDARIKYRAQTVRTGKLPFDKLRLDVTLENRRLTLAPLAFNIAGGRVIAKVDINAQAAEAGKLPWVKTSYDIRLTEIPLGKVLRGFNVEDAGTTASVRGRLQLVGNGDTVQKSLATANGRIALVVPTGQLWVRNIELAELDLQNFLTAMIGKRLKDKRQINCGIVAFTVKNGRAVSDPILIDTDKAVFRGRGGFSFADESLAMSLEADSKQFSLFSGQSPIAINGYFADPSINPISAELLARGGAALALGIVAAPLAAVAAFVDLGDAKDTNCAPLLAAKRDNLRSRAENAVAKK